MPPDLRYLKIIWAEPGHPSCLTVAPEPIEIERAEDGSWKAETEIFHDNLPWIGLRAGSPGEPAPTILLPSGEREAMLKIVMAGQDAFWVENGRWDDVGHRHLSALHRQSGRVTIDVGQTRIVLDHTMGGAGRLDDYLAEFRDEFFWLVVGADSKLRGTVAAGGSLNFDVVDALTEFAAAARAVVQRPASQVREIIEPAQVARVRPTAATFRQYARNSATRMLPSRRATESLDTPENRYLRHLMANAIRLARVAAAGTNGLVSRLNLKRLIALELQSLLPEPPSEPEAQDEYVLSIPCIQCGARHSPGDLRAASGRSGWDLHCRSCHFTSWRTYCHDCQYPIFKNGIQMTYHRTLAHQITNVACPSCGYHFSDHSND